MSERRANIALVEKWAALFNSGDVEMMIRECYHLDAEMRVMGRGAVTNHADFLAFELAVSRAAPRRRITLEALHPFDRGVIVESLLYNPDLGEDWTLPWCSLLTIVDGKISSDRNYLDFSKWPSSDAIEQEMG
ncbi:MAG: nuclear transport factor 2 family protein [bacterium]|nr:nuclear transport factor 2 family protein [bacterium]